MKNLVYKEFKLVLTLPVYLLICLFGLLPLIPTYPVSASLFYIAAIYPMIFLGANKGTQTNDVYFSLTLPCKRKEIVGARFILLSIIQLAFLAIMAFSATLGYFIDQAVFKDLIIAGEEVPEVGFNIITYMALVGFSLLSFSILDLIFLPCFYKTARKFTGPYLSAMIPFAILITVLTIVLPTSLPSFNQFFNTWNPLVQILTLIIGIIAYVGIRYLAYKLACKNFEKVDF